MTPDKLFEQFKVAAVDQTELETLLMWHFQNATGVSAKEIHYQRDGEAFALALHYNNNGNLMELKAGPGLRDEDITKIEKRIDQTLICTTGVSVGQTVLFARQPVNGYFKYRDQFQIIPVPPAAPQLPVALGDHPLLLEFTFPTSEDRHIQTIRRARKAKEIELLCVAFTTGIWKGPNQALRHHWVYTEPQDSNTRGSKYLQEIYLYDGQMGHAGKFTDTSNTQPIPLTNHDAYYSKNGINIGESLELPDNLENQVDCFFNAHPDDRERFLRASFWFQHSQHVSSQSKSASFTALMSAIESLMPKAMPTGHCESCNRPISLGSTKRFKDFVEEFVPDQSSSDADKNKLYSLRSALSHGGSLLHSDRNTWLGSMTSGSIKEWANHDAMLRIVRIALTNWIYHSRGEPL